MSREFDVAQDLYAELLGAVCKDTGLREDLARPFVSSALAYLQATYGGRRIYIPAPERRYPELEIAAHYEFTRDVSGTCRKFSISRSKLFEIVGKPAKRG
jgi:Mor family transcriptional regulator